MVMVTVLQNKHFGKTDIKKGHHQKSIKTKVICSIYYVF